MLVYTILWQCLTMTLVVNSVIMVFKNVEKQFKKVLHITAMHNYRIEQFNEDALVAVIINVCPW